MRLPTDRDGRSSRAYTLIELLIVIAILGISGALLIPNMVGRDVLAGEAAVRRVIGDICFAQSDALAHQEYRRVHFYSDGSGYCITRITQAEVGQAFNAGSADYVIDPLGRLGQYIVKFTEDDRYKGITIGDIAIDGTAVDLQFDQLGGTVMNGGAPGTGGEFTVSAGAEHYKITVAPFTGKLTVVKL